MPISRWVALALVTPSKKHYATLFATLLFTLLCTVAHASKLTELRTIEGITEYSMKNGLQVLLFPDDSKDTITVNITYRTGSKHENYGETGMAHLLEHLLFKGSKNHPDIAKEISQHGATGNASTSLERTNYYQTFKATEENLQWALSMEADRMVNSFFGQAHLDSEMTVVRNELERGENSPSMILFQRVTAAAFDWHNYGKSTIGARSDIENVKIENLRAFYIRYYQPDNATLIVAGKFDKTRTLKHIEKHFGKIKKPKRTLPEFYTQDPIQDGERSVMLRRVGGAQTLLAAYRIPSGAHKDFAALSLLASILGDSPSGRLHKNLTEARLATSAWAWPNQQKDASLMYFNVSADLTTDLEKTQLALLNTLENVSQAPITAEEVERAKRKALKDIEMAFTDSQAISINLSEWIGIGDWRVLFIYRDQIEKVTIDDIQRVAAHYLIPSNRTLGKFIPEANPKRAEIPPAPAIEKLVEGYQGKAEIIQGEVFDATLENVAKREVRAEQGGIQLSMIPIKTRGESVFLEMRMGIGNEDSLQNKTTVRQFTARLLDKGSARFTSEQLQDELDKLMAYGGFSSDEQGIYASFETKKANLPAVIALLHELLTTATFPESEFDLVKSQILSKLSRDKTDPQSLAFNALAQHLNVYPQGHLHAPNTVAQQIASTQAITLDNVKSFYRTHFGTDNMQFAVVGDIDPTGISAHIFSLFGDWPAQIKYQPVLERFGKSKTVEQVIETPDKENAIFIAGINLDVNHYDEDAPALYVVTKILGGGFLEGRLVKRIRVDEGLSYTVSASVSIPRQKETARFYAYAISAPGSTEKVHAAFLEEMHRARKDGFTESELKTAVNGIIDEAKVQRSNNANLASSARRLLKEQTTFLNEKSIHDKLTRLTVSDLNRVMQKYLTPENMAIVKAGDFKQVSGD